MTRAMCIICGGVHAVKYDLVELTYEKSANANSGAPIFFYQPRRELNASVITRIWAFFLNLFLRDTGSNAIELVEGQDAQVNALRTAIDIVEARSIQGLIIGPCELQGFGQVYSLLFRQSNQSKLEEVRCLDRTGNIQTGAENPETSNASDTTQGTLPNANQSKTLSPTRTPGNSPSAERAEREIEAIADPLPPEPPPQEPPGLSDDIKKKRRKDKSKCPPDVPGNDTMTR